MTQLSSEDRRTYYAAVDAATSPETRAKLRARVLAELGSDRHATVREALIVLAWDIRNEGIALDWEPNAIANILTELMIVATEVVAEMVADLGITSVNA